MRAEPKAKLGKIQSHISSVYLRQLCPIFSGGPAAVGHYRDQEFLVVFSGCNAANLIVGAERLRHCIADEAIETSVGPIPVTLSLGLASAEQDDNETLDCEVFLRTADEALYAAKARGRNRVESAPASRVAGA